MLVVGRRFQKKTTYDLPVVFNSRDFPIDLILPDGEVEHMVDDAHVREPFAGVF
jgi:hypothetical protein